MTKATPAVPAVKSETHITAYALQKMLLARGVDRKPQMMYNYVKNGLIKTELVNGQNLIPMDVAVAFVEKFVTKVQSK